VRKSEMYALDTNSVIHFFQGKGHVADRLLAVPPSDVGLPTIVLYEIEVGIGRSSAPERRRRQLTDLVAVVRLLPFGAAEARTAARVRSGLERAGTPIGPLDTLIAGTALHHHATLVTHNVDEFARVQGLDVEDWFG
jgi:tRNA(fMet)-specific endonuclease VapC